MRWELEQSGLRGAEGGAAARSDRERCDPAIDRSGAFRYGADGRLLLRLRMASETRCIDPLLPRYPLLRPLSGTSVGSCQSGWH